MNLKEFRKYGVGVGTMIIKHDKICKVLNVECDEVRGNVGFFKNVVLDNETTVTSLTTDCLQMPKGMSQLINQEDNIYLVSELWWDDMENRNSYGYEPKFYITNKDDIDLTIKIPENEHHGFLKDMPKYKIQIIPRGGNRE